MPIKKSVQELQELEMPKVEALEENDADEYSEEVQQSSIQATKVVKPRSQKQIDAFTRAREIKSQNIKIRNDEKKIQNDARKIELENKLVQKAISVKKKQIKQEQILDEMSDDEEEEEIIYTKNPLIKVPRKVASSKGQKALAKPLLVKEKSKYTFV
tara:strand:- start:3819 stop:4289 length:471 start_codon:yes stop_codon:yes gene_type:complete